MNQTVTFRKAKEQDLDRIVEMLADDVLGSKRECYQNPLRADCNQAFDAIESDPNNELIVECLEDQFIGMKKINFPLGSFIRLTETIKGLW